MQEPTQNNRPKYVSRTIGELAAKYGYSIPTFWSNFTTMHQHDIVELGYRLGKNNLLPVVVEYIERVIMNRESREVFEQLAGKSFGKNEK